MSDLVLKNKVLIVSGIYPRFTGGAEYQMRIIADQLKKDYEIVFVYLGDVPGEEVSSTRVELIEGYKVYFLQSPGKLDTFTLRYFYARRLLEVFKIEKPDFVYQRVLKFISYYIAKHQSKLGYQHFIHIADLFTLDFNRHTLRGKLNYHYFKKTLSYQPKFIVQTTEQKKKLEALGGFPALHVYNMHPSENYDMESICRDKLENSVKNIVWVANIKPIKQLEVLLDLANSLRHKIGIHFVVIGSVQDSEYGSPLVEKMNAMPNITHYSGKNNDFVNEYILKKAFLTINTSKSEGFSNVFIQSWLRGVPVLSLNSNPDGLFDQFKSLGAFCDNNTDELKRQLMKLLDDGSYQTRAIKSYEIAREKFSYNNIQNLRQLLS